MSWFGILSEKPWLPEAQGTAAQWGRTAYTPAVKISLRFLLGIISVFFMLFFVTFISRSQYDDFLALAGEPWQPFTHSWRLWINSGVLVLASVAMQNAVYALRRDQSLRLLCSLAAGALLAMLFIILQISVWQFLQAMGYGVAANPANSYFYILTGLHALHLLGGLVALGRVVNSLRRDGDLQNRHAAIEACALYWHYLLGLWLVLFFMLTRTPETYALIAAACGLG
ncbi:MAG: cytochrome c oxidase subunit 3 [Zhongshania sp.]|uniref:cytochrome c oxidase subunit 3 n=1 Tax=Zhongshania sp. TaxID=1971902 RepID=UPI00262D2D9E|nr:cytochrome c oxidase subunit 3 [Zhongshania sp.]MDF1693963.1 cytochrome c oxidase subunit 3 [Zhongshania sp.]